MKYIKNLNFVLTYKCNLKCKHCDIGNNKDNTTIDFNTFNSIVNKEEIIQSYKYYNSNFELSLSGGEIFLINNIEKYIILLQEKFPNASLCLTTNGIFTDKIINTFYNLNLNYKIKLNISIDGNEKTHDNQRGIKGSFKKTLKTIIKLRKIFPYLLIELKFTITKYNFNYIKYFTQLSDKLGIFFSFKPYENIENYTNKTKKINTNFNKKQIKIIEKQIIDNEFIIKQKKYKSPSFYYKIPSYLRYGLTKREKSNCEIANYDFEIMPNLDVYSCILMNKLGNLNKDSIISIIKGKKIKKQKKIIKEGECSGCLLMCGGAKSEKVYNI